MSFGTRAFGEPRRDVNRARRGGYLAGLLASALGFVLVAACLVAWAFAHTASTPYTPQGIFQLALVAAGPIELVLCAIGLAASDLILRLLKIGGAAAYGLANGLIVSLLACGPTLLLHEKVTIYFVLLAAPAAVIGGAAMGCFRRPMT